MNETNGRRTLREAHAESCRDEGMTEEQIARDWASFTADYDAWMDDRDAGLVALERRGSDAGWDEDPEDLP
jgi:hypothetical protein